MAMPGNDGLGRRRFVTRFAGGAGLLMLGGCDRLSESPWFAALLARIDPLTRAAQHLVSDGRMAREYSEADISAHFRSNGTHDPDDASYQALAKNAFVDWRLEVGGLVEHPRQWSLAELRALPSRTQITRHDCVEGWSCIGKWKGAPLSTVLAAAVPKPEARYVVFYSADPMDTNLDGTVVKYYESIGLGDAYHPQTILAYDMNDATLPVPYGAPLRLRDERQLGYKMAKYIMRIELVESFAHIGGGKGGYWEDQGYEWYAGI
jgi:DMSO/TMAO reductase YedYZ molybdopterin-dependent catalytic subunit